MQFLVFMKIGKHKLERLSKDSKNVQNLFIRFHFNLKCFILFRASCSSRQEYLVSTYLSIYLSIFVFIYILQITCQTSKQSLT